MYNYTDAVTLLPVPLGAKYLENNNGNSAGNGWYLSDVELVSNRPAYVRDMKEWNLVDPLDPNSSAIDWRGAQLDNHQVREGKVRLASFLTLLDALTPALDIRFTLHVGSVDAFITTLPLALLSLLNLSVFMTPLFDARARISFSIQLFFTTTATLLTQNFGGTNQLNAIQRLAVVIFAMLVFTVFSTLVWNGVYNYKEGKAEMRNDWKILTGSWKTSEVFVTTDSYRDLSPMMSPRAGGVSGELDAIDAVEAAKGPNGPGSVYVSKKMPSTKGELHVPNSMPHKRQGVSKSFGQRIRDDRDFRASFCHFCDRLCLIACFIVYLVSFVVICTESSDSEIYGSLNIEDIVAQADERLNTTEISDLLRGWT